MAFKYTPLGDFREKSIRPLTKHRHQSRPRPQIIRRDTLDTLDQVSAQILPDTLLTQKTAHPLSPAYGSPAGYVMALFLPVEVLLIAGAHVVQQGNHIDIYQDPAIHQVCVWHFICFLFNPHNKPFK